MSIQNSEYFGNYLEFSSLEEMRQVGNSILKHANDFEARSLTAPFILSEKKIV